MKQNAYVKFFLLSEILVRVSYIIAFLATGEKPPNNIQNVIFMTSTSCFWETRQGILEGHTNAKLLVNILFRYSL